jgi:uncharacterized membrane protein
MMIGVQQLRYFSVPGKLSDYSALVTNSLVWVLILCLVAVMLGIASGCIRNRCVVISFGVCLTPVWIGLLLASGAISGFMMGSQGDIEAFCKRVPVADKELNDRQYKELEEFSNLFGSYVNDVDQRINKYTSKWMCSEQCPCLRDEVLPWT